MNLFNLVEMGVKAFIETCSELSQVKEIHTGLKDLESYLDLPAIGCKCTGIGYDPESGEEVANGFLEIVSVGDWAQATEMSEGIASTVYMYLRNNGSVIGQTIDLINNIDPLTMQTVTGEVDNKYVCVVQITFSCVI